MNRAVLDQVILPVASVEGSDELDGSTSVGVASERSLSAIPVAVGTQHTGRIGMGVLFKTNFSNLIAFEELYNESSLEITKVPE